MIGTRLKIDDGKLAVVEPLKGSPAEKAGIMAGDVILKINDFMLKSKIELDDIAAAIKEISKHKPGDIIKLIVKRGGKELIIEVRVAKQSEMLKETELKLVITVSERATVRVEDQRVAVKGTTAEVNFTVTEPGIVYLVRVTVELTKDGKKFSETKQARLYEGKVAKLDLSDIAMPNRKRRTLSYWQEVKQIEQDWSKKLEENKSIVFFVAVLEKLGADIAELPTRGVDEDAINACHELAEAIERMAKFAAKNTSNNRLMEVFIKGFLGDPLSVANEVAAEEKAVKEKCDMARTKLRRTRAILSSRYDVEFPNLE